ncbi:hypothetical protein KY290_020645 [Solanum tuberosum]|uniref:Uncharacterized protein n=2 Tax=Solanum tuberosum TaxID=4113 RepID=A0ABQ7UZ89_SOLTU|nr:hypothetical protein KY290_020645 [Solanum tuberosum]
MRGRGRGWVQFHRLHRDWYSGCDFESYGGLAYYRFRHKRNDHESRLDGAAFASNRSRIPLNDDSPSFSYPPARRLSPNGRDAAAMMGIQMNISPSRCTGEDGSEYVGLQHSEKFNRFFPAVYSHQQSMYDDGPDRHFVQGNTKFTEIKRSCFPQMQSKSPIRSRT